MESSEAKDTAKPNEKPQPQESTNKRQRTEDNAAKAIDSTFADESGVESRQELRPSWTIGEEDDDGYVSEDVL